MDLNLKIIKKANGYRAGKLYINNEFFCYTIEDEDRGLTQSMTLKEVQKIKKKGITAIPIGSYQVIMSYSNRFKKYMPELLNVTGFEGIRIHEGNTSANVEGCIAVGFEDSSDGFMGNSKSAATQLTKKIGEILKKEKIWITIS